MFEKYKEGQLQRASDFNAVMLDGAQYALAVAEVATTALSNCLRDNAQRLERLRGPVTDSVVPRRHRPTARRRSRGSAPHERSHRRRPIIIRRTLLDVRSGGTRKQRRQRPVTLSRRKGASPTANWLGGPEPVLPKRPREQPLEEPPPKRAGPNKVSLRPSVPAKALSLLNVVPELISAAEASVRAAREQQLCLAPKGAAAAPPSHVGETRDPEERHLARARKLMELARWMREESEEQLRAREDRAFDDSDENMCLSLSCTRIMDRRMKRDLENTNQQDVRFWKDLCETGCEPTGTA